MKKKIILILAVLALLTVSFYAFTYSKFISDSAWNYYFKSKGFYFSSENLAGDLIQNINNNWNGESVYFNVKNNLNTDSITDYDISYNVDCQIISENSSKFNCYLNGTESNEGEGILSSFSWCYNDIDETDVSSFDKTECELNGYEWKSDIAIKNLYFDIVPIDNHELEDVTVNITVNSTAPYKKTLKGNFILYKNNNNDFVTTYNNYTNYDRFNILNTNSSIKCVSISWNADNLIINNDKDEFEEYTTNLEGYINQIKIKLDANQSFNYIFYRKDNDSSYTIDDFLIEENSDC